MCLQLFKNLFEEGLTLQRERLRELRKYARDKRTEQQKRQQNEIASLENYYKDQFTVLAETLQSEKTELRMRDKAQTDVSTGWFRDSKFPKCDSWPGSSSAILIVERKAALAKNDVTFFINTSRKCYCMALPFISSNNHVAWVCLCAVQNAKRRGHFGNLYVLGPIISHQQGGARHDRTCRLLPAPPTHEERTARQDGTRDRRAPGQDRARWRRNVLPGTGGRPDTTSAAARHLPFEV